MNQYLLHGKLTAKAGHQEELADILLQASKLVSTAKGCLLYAVSKDAASTTDVFVTEIWDCKEEHDQSLHIPGVKELIAKAMPILDAAPQKGQELNLIGGTGASFRY